jgi:hypothetical protein
VEKLNFPMVKILSLALASNFWGVHGAEWDLDGKCHPKFLECVIFCEFSCKYDISPDLIPRLAEEADVLNKHPGSEYVDCVMNDFDRRAKIPGVVDYVKSTFEKLVSSGKDRQKSSHFAEDVERLKYYGSLATADPELYSWSCSNHCEHECMHHALESIDNPVKFFGKWPFQRVLICQEILSSMYSFLNALPYIILLCVRRFMKMADWSVKFYSVVIAIMWCASGLFHCRDTSFTIHVDYFTAFAGVLGNLWLPAFWMSTASQRWKVNLLFFAIWLIHVSYMGFVDFDFEWNMILASAFGVVANIAWTVWYYRNRSLKKHAWLVLVCAWTVVPFFLLMEASDFPPGPMGLADAHSFWHLSTVPVGVLWTVFFFKEFAFRKKKATM